MFRLIDRALTYIGLYTFLLEIFSGMYTVCDFLSRFTPKIRLNIKSSSWFGRFIAKSLVGSRATLCEVAFDKATTAMDKLSTTQNRWIRYPRRVISIVAQALLLLALVLGVGLFGIASYLQGQLLGFFFLLAAGICGFVIIFAIGGLLVSLVMSLGRLCPIELRRVS